MMVDVLMLALFGAVLGVGVANLLGLQGDGQMLTVLAGWMLLGMIGLFRYHRKNRHA